MHNQRRVDTSNKHFKHTPILISAIIVFVSYSLSCCSPKMILNGTMVHTKNNKPVPDAMVYVEIWKNNKPADFTFGITGYDGKVPLQPVIPIPITNRAMASLTAFAKGYSCTVISRSIIEGKYQLVEMTVDEKKVMM